MSQEKIVIYHNPRCSKSRQTLALIEEAGHQPHIVFYLDNPPDEKTLRELLSLLGLRAEQVIRRKEAKEEGVALEGQTEAALVRALAAHPRLLERPIVVRGRRAVLGRPPENVKELL